MIRRIDRSGAALLLAGLGAALLLLWAAPGRPQIVIDSPLYLNESPIVPAGYPLFVRLVGVRFLVPTQVALLVAAATVLALAVQRSFGWLPLSLAVLVGTVANPQVLDFSRSVVSEALFLPLDMLLIAMLLRYCVRGGAWLVVLCAALAGLGVTVRPITYPMVAAILLVALLRERTDWRRAVLIMAACVSAWVTVVGGERVYARVRHGEALTSLTGLHLYAKAALLDARPLDRAGLSPVERQLADAAERRYAPVRALLRDARGSVAYQALLAHYEICIQRDCTRSLRDRSGLSDAAFNRSMMHVGWLRVRQDIPGYLRLAADEFWSLWVLTSRTHPWRAAAFDRYVAAARPLPLEGDINPSLIASTQPSRVALVVRPLFILSGIATAAIVLVFGWLLATRRRTDPAMLAAFGCALAVELVFGFTSVAGVGDGRYTMGMWPNMLTGLLLGAFAIGMRAPGRPSERT